MTDLFTIAPAELTELAQAEGFDLAGVVSVEGLPEPAHAAYLESWLTGGRVGEMEYLKRRNQAGEALRSRVTAAFPWARSVVVCAKNYNAAAPRSVDPADSATGWIARYAWSGRASDAASPPAPSDYHTVLLRRLRVLETALHVRLGDFQSRSYVDTGPMIERALAAQAGVGWTGKNTCTLHQQLGSWLFLAVIVTSLRLPDAARPEPAVDRCGTCSRCLDACPTGALVAPREMDASLCISYLTIEKRGSVPSELRAGMGRQVFGCDICQDVCPWNRRAPVAEDGELAPRPELINPDLSWLASLEEADFRRLFKGSPIERTKHAGLQRNVAIAMGNSGERSFLPKLQEWAAGPHPVLADAAHWAIDRLQDERQQEWASTPQSPSPPAR